ncbi:MAG: pyrimidine 5'-nucleotidase [Zoogloeaceae bacterium]|nr:pyrimidine 5'-nucleotidase [Rhodocyclaceae bacterium]MCP5254701.1 pyrimidine 5'-nucleotidase [Zoogloeaceae bacterium]MCP5294333.1 pyrimidine 5'-nucleotidase [Zoogloeaceae bacterium]MCW5614862.1 pyrimidine 5'-nucleotidase [Rhodocyclaceae bacterium]
MSRQPVWLFDLDNTLHDASPKIFPHINRCMTAYLQTNLGLSREDADGLRMHYWHRYGATLLGLVRHHGTNPGHFLSETHRFESLDQMVVFNNAVKAMLRRLPGRKLVFSNGPRDYAESIVRYMGIRQSFDDVFGIEDMRLQPKPRIQAYRYLLREHDLRASQCVMVEDSAENLRTAKRLGMRTVWISRSLRRLPYVDLTLGSVLELRRAVSRLRPLAEAGPHHARGAGTIG